MHASSHPARSAGFTLIEILVVVLIIGILVTFLSLSIGGRSLDDQLDIQARRLFQTLQLGSEEAESRGIELGFRHTEQGYEFLALDDKGKWIPYARTGALRNYSVESPFYLELRVEGRIVKPVPVEADKEIEVLPQLLLLSSGELTPFTLDFKARDHRPYLRVTAEALGKLELTRPELGP